MNNLYLVGFMGTGKTSVGKAYARASKRRYLDLDTLLEQRSGMPIADIFARSGEPHFRELEKAALREAAAYSDLVVSCGGGIVIDPENVRVMKSSGVMVCLTARPEVILRRTSGNSQRPLLNVPDPESAIRELLEKRAPFYALADHTIDTSDIAVAGVVKQLRNLAI